MKLSEKLIKQLQEDLSKAKTYSDLMGKDGAIKKLIKHFNNSLILVKNIFARTTICL